MPRKTKKLKNNIEKNSSLAEKKYVLIKEIDSQSSAKKIILWISIMALSFIIISIWFVLLKTKIIKNNEKLTSLSIINEISKSIKNFDNQLKDSYLTKMSEDAEDINKLKEEIIEELKQSIDSSLWPTKQLEQLKLSIQLPNDWVADLKNNEAILTTTSSSSTIEIFLIKNNNKLSLNSWVEKNKPEIINDYSIKNSIFKFNDQNKEDETLYYIKEKATTTIDFIYLINSTSTKSIYLIKAFSQNPTEKDKKIIEEIIKTIKILK